MDQLQNVLDALVAKLSQHATLSGSDVAALLNLPTTTRWVEHGSYVVRDGDRPTDCALLIEGFACRHKLTMDGERQIVSIQIPGDVLDFQHLFLDVADHNVQTLTRARLAFVARQAFQAVILSRPNVARAVNISTAIEASVFREWVLNVGRRDGRRRIAHLLCEFAAKMDAQGLSNDSGYNFPMTQEQLGDATGLTSVHVNRMLRVLEEEGLLRRNGRVIAFPNADALREVADFNSRYLHFGRQQISEAIVTPSSLLGA